jgi:hypothetical protein
MQRHGEQELILVFPWFYHYRIITTMAVRLFPPGPRFNVPKDHICRLKPLQREVHLSTSLRSLP